MILNWIIVLLVILLFTAALLLIRTTKFARPPSSTKSARGMEVDPLLLADHLSRVIRCQTISSDNDEDFNRQPFYELHHLLERMYPRLHSDLELRKINDLSLLYKWEGVQSHLDPILLAAHMDVVPVEEASLSEWEYEPFSGDIEEGFVWGRGALDCKHQMISILETVEHLLRQGYQPQRTVYLAIGHDEECGGLNGAARIVDTLESEGIHLEAMIDEGGGVVSGVLPGVEVPSALIGFAEKGCLTLDLSVEASPGHSSMPPRQTAIGVLAKALTKLEANPMPANVEMILPFIQGVSSVLPFSMQVAFANLWLFRGLVRRQLEADPKTNASIRTSTAITVISGGVRENVLPSRASALVNFRILPGDTIVRVTERVRKIINDQRVNIKILEREASDPSKLSPTDDLIYHSMGDAVQKTFGGVPLAPYLMLGMTDARHYTPLCRNVYRFSPILMDSSDMDRVHGNNERISLDNLVHMVHFFEHLIKSWGEETHEPLFGSWEENEA